MKAKVCVHADSVLCAGKIEQNPGVADENGQDKLKISKGFPHTKTQLVLMEKQINSSGKNPRIHNIDYSQRDPDGLGEEEHRAGKL